VGATVAGIFVGKELLSRVLTTEERCSEHPHVCHCAKFE